MPEPIKTRGKLERQGNWSLYGVIERHAVALVKDVGPHHANPVIDAVCAVLNRWESDFAQTGYRDDIEALRDALTTAGCVKEAEVERYYVSDLDYVCDRESGVNPMRTDQIAAMLNRLAQQAEGER